MQCVEHNVKKKKEAGKDFDAQGYYPGRARRTGGAIARPELLKWVAESAGAQGGRREGSGAGSS
eukprot:6007651-Pyramimonas_sp.AAC.1